MDFTRQPIIETVISPRDGHKISIRNSKEANQEEYLVNAVEIVSFGPALFFRCLERKPKAFLLPIADYDVVEVKEARMVLKNISTDKPIKIGEGKSSKEASTNKEEKKAESEAKKNPKKRHSRKRRSSKVNPEKDVEKATEGNERTEPPQKTEPVVAVIFPPPPKIIAKADLAELSDQQKEQASIAKADLAELAKKQKEKASIAEKPKQKSEEKKADHHVETEVASSKDLPPLKEIKEHPEIPKEED